MDWEGAKVFRTVNNRFQLWILEPAEIRRRAQRTGNREEGAFMLSHTWDAVLHRLSDREGQARPANQGGTSKPANVS